MDFSTEAGFSSVPYAIRDYEDTHIRGDQQEGTRRFAPRAGLAVTNHSSATAFTLQRGAFESRPAAEEHIYVFCASTVCNEELARRFNGDVCVEIVDIDRFAHRLRTVLNRKNKRLIHREASCYNEADRWQHEYRFAFGNKTHVSGKPTVVVQSGGERATAARPRTHPHEPQGGD